MPDVPAPDREKGVNALVFIQVCSGFEPFPEQAALDWDAMDTDQQLKVMELYRDLQRRYVH